MVAGVNQKRERYDPLAASPAPRWLVRVDPFRNVVDVLDLTPGADLRRALARGIEQLTLDDWEIEGVSFSGTLVRRGDAHHHLGIVSTDPGRPLGEMWGPHC